MNVPTPSGYVIVDDSTDRSRISNGVNSVSLTAKTEAGCGSGNDFGYWSPQDSAPLWTYTYRVNFTTSPAVAPVVTLLEDRRYVFVDPTKTVGDIDGALQDSAENLNNAFITDNLTGYNSNLSTWRLPDAFVLAGQVSIKAIRATNARYLDYGSGCRGFTFTNGVDEDIESPLFGDGCEFLEYGDESEITDLLPADAEPINSGSHEFVNSLYNYD